MKENGLNWVYLKLELLLGAQNQWLFGSKLEIFGSSLKLGNFGLKELIYLSQKPVLSLQLSYICGLQVDHRRSRKKRLYLPVQLSYIVAFIKPQSRKRSCETTECQLLKDFNIHPRSEFEVFFFDELELHVLGSLKQDQNKFTS